VILDLETTGTWIEKDKIVEIALIRCDPDGTRQQYRHRINPGIPIPAAVTRIIGITDADVQDAPLFQALAPEINAFIGAADFGGFNIERFDLPLLEREMAEASILFSWRNRTIYDAQKIYHLHERRDLTAAYHFYCGKQLSNAHSALADTEAALAVLEEQLLRYGDPDKGIGSLEEFDYEFPEEYFDRGRRFRWWNGELYMAFGKHAGKQTLREIAKKDPSYLRWVKDKNMSPEVNALVDNALKGVFPKCPLPKAEQGSE
jgi:DNA polymerase-3 subunit epsilon